MFSSVSRLAQPPVPQEEIGSHRSARSRGERVSQAMTCCSCGSSGTKMRCLCALRGESPQRAVNGGRAAVNSDGGSPVNLAPASGFLDRTPACRHARFTVRETRTPPRPREVDGSPADPAPALAAVSVYGLPPFHFRSCATSSESWPHTRDDRLERRHLAARWVKRGSSYRVCSMMRSASCL